MMIFSGVTGDRRKLTGGDTNDAMRTSERNAGNSGQNSEGLEEMGMITTDMKMMMKERRGHHHICWSIRHDEFFLGMMTKIMMYQ